MSDDKLESSENVPLQVAARCCDADCPVQNQREYLSIMFTPTLMTSTAVDMSLYFAGRKCREY